ncbi:amidohydrolase family protein [Pseudonocardia lacus]|uniref:amidohydrolase family protein n=1 Tax=Pseudonocardia lacus TaxID=2835865 RepID=UPI0027E2C07C|nr:amidohydrolase family protein [Pseudonocardia lacus]
MTRPLLVRDAEVEGRRVDVHIVDGRVAAIGAGLNRSGADVVDARGGALLPGLVDHHLHLHALAAARTSASCGPPDVGSPAGLAAALAAARADEHGWVRGVGYHASVAGDLDAAGLDRLHPCRPVRLQHRSGALWILNTRAAALLHLDTADHPGVERDTDGRPTGRLWRADDWLRARLPRSRPPDLAAVGAELARHGITAVTDATPDLDPTAITAIAEAVHRGALPPRVHLLGAPLDTPLPPPLTAGPYKIVLADSGLPAFGELADRVRTAHATGRPVAVHCVTREALVLLLAVLDEVGTRPGDRIEHGALVPAGLVGDLARRGLRVVTQPGFLDDRGDAYRRDVPPADLPDLYRVGSLRRAGVPVALSSDAPHGPLDPWTVLRAAVGRRDPTGAVLGPAERLDPAAALAACTAPPEDPGGPPRRVLPGAPSDLVLLDRPLADALGGAGHPEVTVLGLPR